MLEAHELLDDIISFFQPKTLAGKKVLLTAGPTFEPIDPVRGITNLSSGKTGFAIARAARDAGAQVTLIAGPTALATPRGVQRIDVTTAREMMSAVMEPASSRRVYFGRCGGRLARQQSEREQDQEECQCNAAGAAVRTESRHSCDRGCTAVSAVLRRLRCRKRRCDRQRSPQARHQEGAADGCKPRARCLRHRHAANCR